MSLNDLHVYGIWFDANNFFKFKAPNTKVFAPFKIIGYAQYIYNFTTNTIVKSRYSPDSNVPLTINELIRNTPQVLSLDELKEKFKQIFPNEN